MSYLKRFPNKISCTMYFTNEKKYHNVILEDVSKEKGILEKVYIFKSVIIGNGFDNIYDSISTLKSFSKQNSIPVENIYTNEVVNFYVEENEPIYIWFNRPFDMVVSIIDDDGFSKEEISLFIDLINSDSNRIIPIDIDFNNVIISGFISYELFESIDFLDSKLVDFFNKVDLDNETYELNGFFINIINRSDLKYD